MSDATLQPEPIRHRQCGRGLFGPLILIALGVIFLLDQLNIAGAGHIFQYFWPAVIIIFGIELLSWRPHGARAFWGVIAILIGAGLILSNLGYWYFDIGRYWPVILIALGLSLLFRRGSWGPYRRYRYRRHWESSWAGASGGSSATVPADAATFPADGEDTVNGFAIFGGYQRRITSQQFKGGHTEAIFGGVQLDLHRAEIAGDQAILDVTAVFGGVELRVPERWILELRGQPLLGGFSDETHQDTPAPGAKRLIITGFAMFGGVVIKN